MTAAPPHHHPHIAADAPVSAKDALVEDKDTVMESAKLGICDYILKPFSSGELDKRIYRAFEREKQKHEES